MKYIFLSRMFYETYDQKNFPEIERKEDRPHIAVYIKVDDLDCAIPLRSNIIHKHAFWTNKKEKCGLDYSKTIIITDPKYIDNLRKPYIRDDEHKALLGKEYEVAKGMMKYIKKYKKALKRLDIERNKTLCKYSTLQYFHKELKITD